MCECVGLCVRVCVGVCACAVGHPRGGAKVQMYARDDKPAEALFYLADSTLFTNTCVCVCGSVCYRARCCCLHCVSWGVCRRHRAHRQNEQMQHHLPSSTPRDRHRHENGNERDSNGKTER